MSHVVAPDLIGWTDDKRSHCFWKKQPKTQAEIEQAIRVLESQELDCHRYAGTDPAILEKAPKSCCDYAPPKKSDESITTETVVPTFGLLNQSGLFRTL